MNNEEQDITNAVDNMIERYGEHAIKEAELRILELESRGQHEALDLWREVKKRIEQLAAKPGGRQN